MQAIGGLLELFILATVAAAIVWFLGGALFNALMDRPSLQALCNWLARREQRAYERKHGPNSWPFNKGK